MDDGNVLACGLSLADCFTGHDQSHNNMIKWRTNIRYVTQYKVDIPGTPREFILNVSNLSNGAPSENDLVTQTLLYLQEWGMGENEDGDNSNKLQHSYLDKEWKVLSGGESQRMLLAIAMASQARVLLLDESTSGKHRFEIKLTVCMPNLFS